MVLFRILTVPDLEHLKDTSCYISLYYQHRGWWYTAALKLMAGKYYLGYVDPNRRVRRLNEHVNYRGPITELMILSQVLALCSYFDISEDMFMNAVRNFIYDILQYGE